MLYLVTHFYLPLSNPPANRMGRLARILVAQDGHANVRVITGRPNYPDGRLPKEYRWRLYRHTVGPAGEPVVHLYEMPAPFRGFLRKTLGYLSFGVSVFLYFLFRPFHPNDLVLVTMGPAFPAYALLLLCRFKRHLRYIVDVRDLIPQSYPSLGFLRAGGFSYRVLKALSDATYRHAVWGVGVVPGICEYIRCFQPPDRVSFIPNPVDLDLFRPLSPEVIQTFKEGKPEFFAQRERVVFVCSGALSVYRDLMTLMSALDRVRKTSTAFTFLIIGYGEEKPRLEAYVRDHNLSEHVFFLPYLAQGELVQYIAAADYGYFSSQPDPIFDMAIPLKAIEYLACGKPLVCAHGGAFARELQERGVARVAPPGDEKTLATTLLDAIRVRPSPDVCAKARAFAEAVFSPEQFSRRYLEVLAQCRGEESRRHALPESSRHRRRETAVNPRRH